MAYTNFFISLIILIATSTILILTKNYLISKVVLTIIFGVLISLYIFISITLYIKNLRAKKILNFKIPDIATNYYKDKYQKVLSNYHLELEYSIDFLFIKEYSGAAYIYMDKERTKYIYIYLNSKFELANINDNIEDDIVLKDIETILLSNTKEKYNALYSVKLYKRSHTGNQYSYKNDINEYLINNCNIKFTISIIKKIENKDKDFDYVNYCNNFSEDIYSSLLKDFNDIEIDMGIIFVRNEELYNRLLEDIKEYDYADILFLFAFDGTDYEELKNDKYDCFILHN